MLATLQKQLSTVETGIDTAIRDTPPWHEKCRRLRLVPGSLTILSPNGLESALSYPATSAPSPVSLISATTVANGAVNVRLPGARSSVRAALYLAGLPAIRRRLPIAATMRELLVILNAIIRDNTPWRLA